VDVGELCTHLQRCVLGQSFRGTCRKRGVVGTKFSCSGLGGTGTGHIPTNAVPCPSSRARARARASFARTDLGRPAAAGGLGVRRPEPIVRIVGIAGHVPRRRTNVDVGELCTQLQRSVLGFC
jgi:hypothetical protein